MNKWTNGGNISKNKIQDMFIVHHSLQSTLNFLSYLSLIIFWGWKGKQKFYITLSFYIWEIWVTSEGHRLSMSELGLELKEPELFQDSFSSG